MSNSIDQLYVKSSLVEFRQHPTKAVCPSSCQQCRTPSTRLSGASVQQCRTPSTVQAEPSCVQSWDSSRTIRHGELSSCAIHTLNTCNLVSTRPSAASDSKKNQGFQVELSVRTYWVIGITQVLQSNSPPVRSQKPHNWHHPRWTMVISIIVRHPSPHIHNWHHHRWTTTTSTTVRHPLPATTASVQEDNQPANSRRRTDDYQPSTSNC